MKPLTRRQALRLGILGGLGVLAGSIGLSRSGLPWRAPAGRPAAVAGGGEMLLEPEVVRSRNGVLRVELVAAPRDVAIAGRPARMLAYNGTVPGQTWRVRPGDRIEVRLRNELDAPTNLHTHGLAVSPQGNGDNPFVSVAPGGVFDYPFELPPDHPTGVFWYHPHLHGSVADQLFGGLYGTLVVEDDEAWAGTERVLVISDVSLGADGRPAPASAPQVMMGREGELLLVNGQQRPRLSARPGQRERWRVVNACASRYLHLALPGQLLELLGVDGGREMVPREVTELLLAPGNRADLLVTLREGSSELRTLGYDRGGMGMMGGGLSGPAILATLDVAGEPEPAPGRSPVRVKDPDLRGRPVARRRRLAFTMDMGAMMGGGPMTGLGFDGRAFDPQRIDQRARVGTVEEWLVSNPTPMHHPFHLHVWPMQLIEESGRPLSEPAWRDVVNVPAGGSARILVDFTRHPGRSVYHCHVLDHEDAGMMGIIEVG